MTRNNSQDDCRWRQAPSTAVRDKGAFDCWLGDVALHLQGRFLRQEEGGPLMIEGVIVVILVVSVMSTTGQVQ